MRFLVDECCDTELIAGLRADGHDVLAVEEYRRSEVDEEVLRIAFDEERILVTEDRDFGELVFRFQLPARGVVYLRFPVTKGDQKLPRMRDLLRDATERLPGAFSPGRSLLWNLSEYVSGHSHSLGQWIGGLQRAQIDNYDD